MQYQKEYRKFYECKIYVGSVNYSTKDVELFSIGTGIAISSN